MTGGHGLAILTAAGSAAAALALVLPSPGRTSRRLRQVVPVRGTPSRVRGAHGSGSGRVWRLLPAAVGATSWLLVGGFAGLVAAAVAGGVVWFGLRWGIVRLATDPLRPVPPSLPLCLDLMAAGLRAGGPVGGVVDAVAAALDDETGDAMRLVSSRLRLGMDPAQAWAAPGWDRPWPDVVRDVARASDAGTALAATLARHATALREARRQRGVAAVRRASVLAVLPVGLCFLPAFVLLAVVPVVGGLVGGLLG